MKTEASSLHAQHDTLTDDDKNGYASEYRIIRQSYINDSCKVFHCNASFIESTESLTLIQRQYKTINYFKNIFQGRFQLLIALLVVVAILIISVIGLDIFFICDMKKV